MKKKMNSHSLTRNHSTGHQPELAPSHTVEIGAGARQPPRNSVVARADSVARLMYSARKNIANFSEEYSVWKPPTSSPSPSGKSNGMRFDSPIIVITYTMKDGNSSTTYHLSCCAATMSAVDIEPANMKAATDDSSVAIS